MHLQVSNPHAHSSMKHLVSQLPRLGSVCLSCRLRLSQSWSRQPSQCSPKRLLTTTPHGFADRSSPSSPSSTIPSLGALSSNRSFQLRTPTTMDSYPDFSGRAKQGSHRLTYKPPPAPHRLHVYATKHNCHITLAQGNRDSLLSISAGNLGFRKAQRGTYDAAYQLAAFVLSKITSQGMLSEEYPGKGGSIRSLEIVLRDFGPGREAFTKVLLGNEGRLLRTRVLRVMDSTRLKFGGTRSPKPRRLG